MAISAEQSIKRAVVTDMRGNHVVTREAGRHNLMLIIVLRRWFGLSLMDAVGMTDAWRATRFSVAKSDLDPLIAQFVGEATLARRRQMRDARAEFLARVEAEGYFGLAVI